MITEIAFTGTPVTDIKRAREFKFTLVEIAPLEESLRLTPWQRLLENDKMLNRLRELEAFMEKFLRGYNFIHSQHVHSR